MTIDVVVILIRNICILKCIVSSGCTIKLRTYLDNNMEVITGMNTNSVSISITSVVTVKVIEIVINKCLGQPRIINGNTLSEGFKLLLRYLM